MRRGGHTVRLPAAELVPGDLIVLEAGAQVPADARLLKSATLRVNEATLTGESEPVAWRPDGWRADEKIEGSRP